MAAGPPPLPADIAGTTINDVPLDVLSSTLRRLDGRSLAAASCSATLLHSLAADSALWRSICHLTWPSLCQSSRLSSIPARRLFADAFPFPSPSAGYGEVELPNELISAVDVYCDGAVIFSSVVETSTRSSWFLTAPFCIEAVDQREKLPAVPPSMSVEKLELSWILVDPATQRAVNVSSRKPVMVDRLWYTAETVARFAVVVEDCAVSATVTWSEDAGHVREVSLVVEDADGMAMSGGASLRVLESAMAGGRKSGDGAAAAARRTYEEFTRRKKGRKEQKARREVMADLCCSAVGALIVLAVASAILCRRLLW